MDSRDREHLEYDCLALLKLVVSGVLLWHTMVRMGFYHGLGCGFTMVRMGFCHGLGWGFAMV